MDEEHGDPNYDGARLRRERLRRELDLEQIAVVTKVTPSYLSFIEEDQYEALPAPVYVRGFVAAYARCLGLDAEAVAKSYMERYDQRMTPVKHPKKKSRRRLRRFRS